MRHLTLLFLFLSMISFSNAQEITNKKFGEVKISDFGPTAYAPDSQANAIVLAESGNSKIIGNGAAFTSSYYEHKRIRVLNKNGFDHATVEIYLYRCHHPTLPTNCLPTPIPYHHFSTLMNNRNPQQWK